MKYIQLVYGTVLILATQGAFGYFKCTNGKGESHWTDKPCQPGEKQTELAANTYDNNAKPTTKLSEPRIGMSEGEVGTGTSWGRPNKVNKTTNSDGVFEQWVYTDVNGTPIRFLHFKNGKLTSISE